MPELDFALLGDYVRVEGGLAHVIAAGIDTVNAAHVPTGHTVGLLFRVEFTQNECGRAHRLEVIFQDEDGQRLAHLTSVVAPEWKTGLPAHWKTGLIGGFNFGVPLPAYGVYAFEIMLNDSHVKTLKLRVIPRNRPGGEVEPEADAGDSDE